MKYLLTLIFLGSIASSFADHVPANRGYGDLFFREPPRQDDQNRNYDRETIYTSPDYYYDSPSYYYQSPGYYRNYDPFPDATRAKEIYKENVKK